MASGAARPLRVSPLGLAVCASAGLQWLLASAADFAFAEGTGHCGPSAVGLGASLAGYNPAESLSTCGVALLRHAFPEKTLKAMMDQFLMMPQSEVEDLRHGAVRTRRIQTHMPHRAPFDQLPLLGAKGQLLEPLAAALGPGFVLDLATVVEVPAGAAAQEPHRDTPLVGSVAAHVPLHALGPWAAPLGMCAGTHTLPQSGATDVMREALLWRQKNESSDEAKRRLFCGGRKRTDAFNLTFVADDRAYVKVRDSRLGAVIVGFIKPEAEALEWKLGDEITHVNDQEISGGDDWVEIVADALGKELRVRVERPRDEPPPSEPPRLVVGAPLAVGDALLYDSRTWHWGMANTGSDSRYVLYVNFKNSTEHRGVHPEAHGTKALKEARKAYQDRVLELRDAGRGPAEL